MGCEVESAVTLTLLGVLALRELRASIGALLINVAVVSVVEVVDGYGSRFSDIDLMVFEEGVWFWSNHIADVELAEVFPAV